MRWRARRRPRGGDRSHLGLVDLARVGVVGLRIRRLRTTLTALGIAIGIAAMVAVVGISSSSKANLIAEIDALGTGLLRVAPGQTMAGETTTLPDAARDIAARIGPVTATAGFTQVDATVRRTDTIDPHHTNGIRPLAADIEMLAATGADLDVGRNLDAASEQLPTVLLGADAADRLGIRTLDGHPRVYIGGVWFAVIGLLDPVRLAPELDSAALIGYPVAAELFATTLSPSTLFVRAAPDQIDAVRGVLGRSLRPDRPNEVDVSRPSDALEARARTDETLRRLLLGLGGVALVVGGVGITNVMVISVLERRNEIGVRRALGARRMHIAGQFITEAAVLATLGGLGGVSLGAAITAVYAKRQGWLVDVPITALAGGVAAALVVGLVAGVSPAVRAARLDPADALRV